MSLETDRPWPDADNFRPSNVEVKNLWVRNSILQYAFMAHAYLRNLALLLYVSFGG